MEYRNDNQRQNEESKCNNCEELNAKIKVLAQQNDELRSESAIKTATKNSINEEMENQKANEKENYLDEEERKLVRDFIIKIKKELELNN